jgi:hypothetical protein
VQASRLEQVPHLFSLISFLLFHHGPGCGSDRRAGKLFMFFIFVTPIYSVRHNIWKLRHCSYERSFYIRHNNLWRESPALITNNFIFPVINIRTKFAVFTVRVFFAHFPNAFPIPTAPSPTAPPVALTIYFYVLHKT